MSCSSAFVSVLAWNSGSERVTPVQSLLVQGSAEKILLNGSSELYVLALSGRLYGLQSRILSLWKQLWSVSKS